MSRDELLLLAHLLGDGCTLPNQPVHYTSGDLENINLVAQAAARLFGIKPRIVPQQNWWHVYLPSPYRLTHGKHNPIIAWLQRLGTDAYHAWEKRIPGPVFTCPEAEIAFFLRHLWSTDGNISWKRLAGRKPAAAIYYASTSELLASQVQHLLLRLGIHSTLKKVLQPGYRPIFHVHIQGCRPQLDFLRTVGYVGARAKIIPELIAALEEIVPHATLGALPRVLWKEMIEPVKVAAGVSWRAVASGLDMQYCGSALFKAGISSERLGRLADVLKSVPLRELADAPVYWDTIASLEPLGVENVYDATVANTHNFVANDIIIHNSIEQDSDVVMFIYRKDRDKPNVGPEEENIAEIIVAKHRNGPTGSIRLRFDQELASFQTIDKVHTQSF